MARRPAIRLEAPTLKALRKWVEAQIAEAKKNPLAKGRLKSYKKILRDLK